MNTKGLQDERTRFLQHVKGVVLEIVFGTGLNLRHYPPTVTRIVRVDPSETFAKLALSAAFTVTRVPPTWSQVKTGVPFLAPRLRAGRGILRGVSPPLDCMLSIAMITGSIPTWAQRVRRYR